MNWLGQIGLNYGTASNGLADLQKNQLAAQILGQQAQTGQNTLSAQELAGKLLPAFLGGQPIPGGAATAPAPAVMTPPNPVNAAQLFGPSAPGQPTDFHAALMQGAPPAPMQNAGAPMPQAGPQMMSSGVPSTQEINMAAPNPTALPGAQRYAALARALQNPDAQGYNPAARFGAMQQMISALTPEDKLYNQQLVQDMRAQMLNDRLNSMIQMQGMRDTTSRANTTDRVGATTRGQDMREPDSVDALKFQAENDAKLHRSLVAAQGYNPTPGGAAQVAAAEQAARASMQAYQQAVGGKSKAPATPTPTTETPAPAEGGDTRVIILDKNGAQHTVPKSQLQQALDTKLYTLPQ